VTTEKPQLKPLYTWRSAIADSDLPPTARHVALTLALHMNERGDSCFPSLTRLERETGLSRSGIAKHLNVLEREGWLVRDRGGPKHSTRYTALIPGGSAPGGLGVVHEVDWGSARGGHEVSSEDSKDYNSLSKSPSAHPAKSRRLRTRGTSEDREALQNLVDLVDDSDEGTYQVWASTFLGKLDARHFHHVAELLVDEWREVGVGAGGGDAIRSEAAFVYRALNDFVLGYSSLPGTKAGAAL
jgi:Helix-turn-helix domain